MSSVQQNICKTCEDAKKYHTCPGKEKEAAAGGCPDVGFLDRFKIRHFNVLILINVSFNLT